MYFTEINGNKATYYDNRLEIGDMVIPYDQIFSLTQTFEDTPVFKFKYKGFDFSVPCKEDEYKAVLEYFIKAAELSPNTDPVKFLSSVKTEPESKKPEPEKEPERPEAAQSYSYGYNYGQSSRQRDEWNYDDRSQNYREGTRSYNKHFFVWVCTFLFGIFGIDRFARGQIGMGLLKIFTAGGCGYWYLFDWVIAMIKAYGSAYRDTEDLYFNPDGSYTR